MGFFVEGGRRGRHNPTTQHVAGFVLERSNYMKGCYERHKLQAVICIILYLLGNNNKKKMEYVLSIGEAQVLIEMLRAPWVTLHLRRCRSGQWSPASRKSISHMENN